MSAPAAAAPAASNAGTAVAPNHTLLYIANLPFSLTAEELTAWVKKEANVQLKDVSIVMRKGKDGLRSRGLGFGQVSNDHLQTVLGLAKKDLNGREFDVQVAKLQVVGGGEKPKREPKEKKAAAPKETNANAAAGEKKKPRRRAKKASNAEGAKKKEDAAAADGSASSAPAAARKERTSFPAEFKDSHTLLYVNNLSFDATEADVSTLFSDAGVKPERVELVASKFGKFRGRSRGFGFVLVKNADVDKAVKLAGTSFQGRDIGVAPAQKQ